jgi:ribosomal protein S18 acetylase RimI-like enzyme
MSKLRQLKKEDQKELIDLFKQLVRNKKSFNISGFDINLLMKNPDCYCIVIENKEKVIGFGSITIYQTPIDGYKGKIEDIIVHENHRGKGIGKKIVKELINIGKKRRIKKIDLTSHPSRVAAGKLYDSLGFKQKETRVFVLNL